MTPVPLQATREENVRGAGGREIFVRSSSPAAGARGVVAIAVIQGWIDAHLRED